MAALLALLAQLAAPGVVSAAPAPDPKAADAIAKQGLALLQQGKFTEAEARCRRALELDRDSRQGWTCLYNVFTNTGRFEAGLAEAERQAKRRPDEPLHRQAWARTHSRRGEKRLKSEDLEGAAADFLAALALHPQDSVALDELGWIRYKQKDYREALRWFNRSLKMDLAFAPNYIWRGRVFLALGRPVMALADFERAKNLQPKVWKDISADVDEATTAYLRALDPKKKSPPAQGMAAIVYDMGSLYREWREEIAYYAGALAQAPKDSDARYGRGALHFELGEYDPAISDFDAAAAADPAFWGRYLPPLIAQARERRAALEGAKKRISGGKP